MSDRTLAPRRTSDDPLLLERSAAAAVTAWQPVRSPASATVEILTPREILIVHCIPGCIVIDRFERLADDSKGEHVSTRFHELPEWTWPLVQRWAASR